MPLPEGYLPRTGDEVLIRCKVSYDVGVIDSSDMVHLKVSNREWQTIIMQVEQIHHLYLRKWNIGERVKSVEFDGPGTVLAVSDEWVWVICESGQDAGGRYTLTANELEPYVEVLETMTEKELLAGLEHLIPPPAPGSQADIGDNDEIAF